MSHWQWFFLGMMVGWTPAILFAVWMVIQLGKEHNDHDRQA